LLFYLEERICKNINTYITKNKNILIAVSRLKARSPRYKTIAKLKNALEDICNNLLLLMKEVDVTYNNIGKVYLGGGFGNHINADSAVRIGLLPGKFRNHIVLAGNSSLGGAVDSLLNPDREEKVIEILKKVHYIELSSNPDFNDYFAEYMMFNDK